MDTEFITLWTPRVKKKRMFISNIREYECKYFVLIFAHANANSKKKHANICICECEYSDHH